MYYSYVEIEYVATSFSPARTDLALKLLTVEKVKELVKSDHFKFVVVLTREDLYFGFSLSEKAERRRIFEIILSGGDTGDHIVGWLVSKNLPQWVGNYSDWLMLNKDPTKKLFGEEDSLRPYANCGGSNGDMSSVSDVD
jgi:hypothetical protein